MTSQTPDIRQRPLSVHPGMTAVELIRELQHSAFGARRVAQACLLAESWSARPGCRVIVTVSGALSIAQQTSIIAQLIAQDRVHAVVTTGAVVTHSLTQERGGSRRPVLPGDTDEALAHQGLNRVFDSIESDANLKLLLPLVDEVSTRLEGPMASCDIVEALGESRLLVQPELVAHAARKRVPIFVPALSDSELGLELAQVRRRDSRWRYDPFLDLDRYKEWLRQGTDHAILSLGGGVPRNWAQQMFAQVSQEGSKTRLVTGIRVCPDPAELGHLSGSTFSEARSWRKIPTYDPVSFVEVFDDATVVFPLLAISMMQNRR